VRINLPFTLFQVSQFGTVQRFQADYTRCGLPDDVEERLDKEAPDWRVSGK
jgi:hypothetical protein